MKVLTVAVPKAGFEKEARGRVGLNAWMLAEGVTTEEEALWAGQEALAVKAGKKNTLAYVGLSNLWVSNVSGLRKIVGWKIEAEVVKA